MDRNGIGIRKDGIERGLKLNPPHTHFFLCTAQTDRPLFKKCMHKHEDRDLNTAPRESHKDLVYGVLLGLLFGMLGNLHACMKQHSKAFSSPYSL